MSTSSQTRPVNRDIAENHPPSRASFVTTHWSLVMEAGSAEGMTAREALSELCRTYWYPLYSYVRRRGYDRHDAQDLTQEFFARLLAGNWLAQADRNRGRFRSFLLTSFKHFLAKEWRKGNALKRGGGRQAVPFPLDTAESRYCAEPADHATPDRHFERRWALALLEGVLERLCAEWGREGRSELFEELRPCLVGERSALPYAALAARLGMTESAVKVTVHRMRRRYRQLLREVVGRTVASSEDIQDEIRHLQAVLASP